MEQWIIDAACKYTDFNWVDIESNLKGQFNKIDMNNAYCHGFNFAQEWTSIKENLPKLYTEIFIKSSNTKTIFSGYLNESGKFVGNDFPFEDYIELDITDWKYILS